MTMKVIYRNYESDQGLEEIQARIYNDELKRNPQSAFGEVTADGIKQRFIREKKDPKGVTYALKEDGNPLAYIQVSFSTPQSWIGYPWAMEECPAEVQEKLYSEMLEYIKTKYPENEIVMGYLTETWKRQVSFAEKKGFVVKDKAHFYKLDTKKIAIEIERDYEVKIGDQDDVDRLIELCKSDPNLKEAFPDDEAWISYFKDRVIPDGHAVMIFKGAELICAGAPLKGFNPNGIIVRFAAIRPGNEKLWKPLMIEITMHCKEMEWDEPLLFNSFSNKERADEVAEELGAVKIDTQVLFVLKE